MTAKENVHVAPAEGRLGVLIPGIGAVSTTFMAGVAAVNAKALEPVLLKLARERELPICGTDFKTGETFIKTVLATAFKARLLGISAGSRRTSRATATGRCWQIRARSKRSRRRSSPLCSRLYPELYRDLYHCFLWRDSILAAIRYCWMRGEELITHVGLESYD